MLGECRRLFANAQNTANRLAKYNGLTAEALYPSAAVRRPSRPGPYGDYVLFVGRLESIKRPDLAVRAMLHVDRPIRLVMVGDGTQRARTEELAASLGVADRIDFAGIGRTSRGSSICTRARSRSSTARSTRTTAT